MHKPDYNHKVRLAVSDKYVELGKLRQEVTTKLMRVTESLKNDMPVSQYKCLQQEKRRYQQTIHELDIRRDVLDEVRELCLNIAEEG